MPEVDLNPDAIALLNGLVEKEHLENLSDAIRFLFNGFVIKSAVIDKQDKEIQKLDDEIKRFKEQVEEYGKTMMTKMENLNGEIKRLKGIMETAGIV